MNQAVGGHVLWPFFRRVQSTLSEDDPRYPFYLRWLAESASNAARSQIGPDSLESLKRRLEQTDPHSDEFDQELVENILEGEDLDLVKYRFDLMYVLCEVYVELGEIRNAIDVLEAYHDEFQDLPLYGVIRGEILVQEHTQEETDTAIESVWRTRENHPEWAEIQKGVAGVIAEALDTGFTYQGYNSDIPENRAHLLKEAKKAIDEAISSTPGHPDYLFIKGRIQTLDARFDRARRTVRRAIEQLNPNRPAYERILSQYRLELSNIDIQEQEHRLKSETSEAIDRLEDLREDYEEASQRFQTRMLQFLGFFTGIIGIVLISVQVAISVDSTTAAIRLILILIGGLLFAFGGFSFILPSGKGDSVHIRIFGVLISGAILILTGVII